MPNMASLTLVMNRRSIDLKWVHIQERGEIRCHSIKRWRLTQKTEIMTLTSLVTVLWHTLVPGGTRVFTMSI